MPFRFNIDTPNKSFITKSLKRFSRKFGLLNYLVDKENLDNYTSLLLAYYTAGNKLETVKSGQIGDISYRAMITMPNEYKYAEPIMKSGAIIYAFSLNFTTDAHLIGLGNEAPMDKLQLKSLFFHYKLERVVLEGDFNEHFDLYAAAGQQQQSRYVMDPEAMLSFMNFLQYNFWEIAGSEMYVVISRDHKKSNDALKEAPEFLEQITPAILEKYPTKKSAYDPEKFQLKNKKLLCPVCSKQLAFEEKIFICPDQHGILLPGSELVRLRKKERNIEIDTGQEALHGPLKCPYCGQAMRLDSYENADFQIDTCSNCLYRWLDASEVNKV